MKCPRRVTSLSRSEGDSYHEMQKIDTTGRGPTPVPVTQLLNASLHLLVLGSVLPSHLHPVQPPSNLTPTHSRRPSPPPSLTQTQPPTPSAPLPPSPSSSPHNPHPADPTRPPATTSPPWAPATPLPPPAPHQTSSPPSPPSPKPLPSPNAFPDTFAPHTQTPAAPQDGTSPPRTARAETPPRLSPQCSALSCCTRYGVSTIAPLRIRYLSARRTSSSATRGAMPKPWRRKTSERAELRRGHAPRRSGTRRVTPSGARTAEISARTSSRKHPGAEKR